MRGIYADFEKLDAQTFCEVVECRAGSAVASQARSIFVGGDAIDNQNPNAVSWIADIAHNKGESAIAQDLRDWLRDNP